MFQHLVNVTVNTKTDLIYRKKKRSKTKQLIFYAMGVFSWHGRKEKRNASDKYKDTKTDHLYPMLMFTFII